MEGIKFIQKLKYSWQKVSAQIIYETEILEVQEKWEVMQLMELAKPNLIDFLSGNLSRSLTLSLKNRWIHKCLTTPVYMLSIFKMFRRKPI